MSKQDIMNKKTISLSKLDIRTLSDEQLLVNEYANICSQYKSTERWIMMVDPEADSLEQLVMDHSIDPTRVLRVSSRHHPVKLNNIERTLLKGNCSALILCNPKLKSKEVSKLTKVVAQSDTQCIILNTKHKLH